MANTSRDVELSTLGVREVPIREASPGEVEMVEDEYASVHMHKTKRSKPESTTAAMDAEKADYEKRVAEVKNIKFGRDQFKNIAENISFEKKRSCASIMYRYLVYLKVTFNEIKKAKFNFFIGFFAVFFSVMVFAILQSVLLKAPVIFLRLAEIDEGENDLVLEAGDWTGYPFLNYSTIEYIASTSPINRDALQLHTARTEFSGTVFATTNCSNAPASADFMNSSIAYDGGVGDSDPTPVCAANPTSGTRNCIREYCGDGETANIYLYDDAKEKAMGFGRTWTYEKPQPYEAILGPRLGRRLGVAQNDTVMLRFSVATLLEAIVPTTDELYADPNLTDSMIDILDGNLPSAWDVLYIPARVAAVSDGAKGKVPEDDTVSNIFMDFTSFAQMLRESINPVSRPYMDRYLQKMNMKHYASKVIFNIPNRINELTDPNFDVIQKRVVDFASKVLYSIGFPDIDTELNLLSEMSSLRFFNLFLGLILALILSIMAALVAILIYSLLMISVETRTFEMGVQRMLGMERKELFQLILIQGMVYAIPGWALGLAMAQVGQLFVFDLLSDITFAELDPIMSGDAIALSVVLGVGVPLLASLLPIRRALGKDLRESLDVRHSKTKAVKFSIERSDNQVVSWSLIASGLVAAGFGFIIYYVFPLSLLTFNLSLLLYMIFGLLLAMLIGLVLLSLNVERFIQFGVIWVFLWWTKAANKLIIQKNLNAHRERNRKTAIMYGISLAFIIFIQASFTVQVDIITYGYQQQYGAYLSIEMRDPAFPVSPLAMAKLEQYASNNTNIQDYAWSSFSLGDAIGEANRGGTAFTRLLNIGKNAVEFSAIYAASPNFFDVTLDGFLTVTQSAPSGRMNLSESLYSPRGSQSALIGEGLRDSLVITMEDEYFTETNVIGAGGFLPTITYERMRPEAFIEAAPVFIYSQFTVCH
uniref:ABC3 transporter permease C-terminal domain-containing protein n=1 Tax=Palpitomonas bilix TaxID=652834 RepID=A0A7S3DHJ4_9EUKA|mmetsp:Transcript_37941/g.97931  ORF Transcript_37941/g.97931 Transcript_37941/m.97931 type:complete len:932 (+) Transcript_37941:120-2915(+)